MGESHDCSDKAPVLLVRIDSSDIEHIDFDIIRLKVQHSEKIAVSGSEIVYGDLETKISQGFYIFRYPLGFYIFYGFENLEDDPVRIDGMFIYLFIYQSGKVVCSKILFGQIDREMAVVFGHEFTHFFYYTRGERRIFPIFFDNRKEPSWGNEIRFFYGIVHTYQTFEFPCRTLFYRARILFDFLEKYFEKVVLKSFSHKVPHFEKILGFFH